MSISAKDYPIIDVSIKFCEAYINGTGLVDLHPIKDKAVIEWLQELRFTSRIAETAVLAESFRKSLGKGGAVTPPHA